MDRLTYRTLTPVHERNLIRRYRRGVEAAGQQLALAHEPYMRMKARRFVRNPFFTMDDALHAARIGLFRAISKFKLSRRVRLLTYASWWMLHELQRAQRSVVGECRPGVNAQGKGQNPIYAVRLDAVGDDGRTMLETISANTVDPDEEVGESRRQERIKAAYREAILSLEPRERIIARERLSQHELDRTTFEQLGERLGLSRERVRQIERDVKVKLRLKLVKLGGRELLAA